MASRTYDKVGLALPAVGVSGRGFDWTLVSCWIPAPWAKNLRGGAPVTSIIKGRTLHGTATILADKPKGSIMKLLILQRGGGYER
jgi:hypothetical protein